MKINKKSHVSDDSSSFTRLPDEMVLQILSKIIDFKTLCLCELVSKRFWTIVHQVDTIGFTSFTHPLADPPKKQATTSSALAFWNSYWSAMLCMTKFRRVKSLCIQFPSSLDNTHLLFKWKIKFGDRVDSLIFLSPNSVYHDKQLYAKENGHQEEEFEDMESYAKKREIAFKCVEDVFMRIRSLMNHITYLPLLGDITIIDSGKQGKVSLGGEKVTEMRNLLHSSSDVTELSKYQLDFPRKICQCYVPMLELPVLGYVMKGVTVMIFGRNDLPGENIDNCMNIELNDSEDIEEAAFSEAVMEILKKHRSRFESLN